MNVIISEKVLVFVNVVMKQIQDFQVFAYGFNCCIESLSLPVKFFIKSQVSSDMN